VINSSHGQGRALTFKFIVEKPRDNLIVRLWSHDKVMVRFSSKSDLTDYRCGEGRIMLSAHGVEKCQTTETSETTDLLPAVKKSLVSQ
jgi:hypothetical protein